MYRILQVSTITIPQLTYNNVNIRKLCAEKMKQRNLEKVVQVRGVSNNVEDLWSRIRSF